MGDRLRGGGVSILGFRIKKFRGTSGVQSLGSWGLVGATLNPKPLRPKWGLVSAKIWGGHKVWELAQKHPF